MGRCRDQWRRRGVERLSSFALRERGRGGGGWRRTGELGDIVRERAFACSSSGRKTRVQEKDRVQGAGSRVQQKLGAGSWERQVGGQGARGAGRAGRENCSNEQFLCAINIFYWSFFAGAGSVGLPTTTWAISWPNDFPVVAVSSDGVPENPRFSRRQAPRQSGLSRTENSRHVHKPILRGKTR